MLTRKDWHTFKLGEKLLWEFYDSVAVVEVTRVGPNYVSVIISGTKGSPFRLWEDDLKNLTRFKKNEKILG